MAKYPLQLVLRHMIIINELSSSEVGVTGSPEELLRRQYIADLVKYALIVAASAPLLIVYPFVQKYFIKGMMIGSVKG